MTIKIGISPIAWQNDDLPELTAAYTMEQALQESREIGYTGVERGQRMPKDTDGLKAYLDKYDIALCGGWCSGHSLVLDFADETAAIKGQVEQFKALDAQLRADVFPALPSPHAPKPPRPPVIAYTPRASAISCRFAVRALARSRDAHRTPLCHATSDSPFAAIKTKAAAATRAFANCPLVACVFAYFKKAHSDWIGRWLK